MLGLERGVDRVVDVDLLNSVVDLRALALNSFKKFVHADGGDLIHFGVTESRSQFASEAGGPIPTASAGSQESLHDGINLVDGEADGMGELLTQEEEFGDPFGLEVGGVDLAVSFKRGKRFEEAYPFGVLFEIDGGGTGGMEMFEVDVEEDGAGGGAFDVATELNELPTFAMIHGRIGDALKEVGTVADAAEKVSGFRFPIFLDGVGPDVMEELINLLPHL